ncbi:MAG: glucose 1-dehydrogenase [Chloroflexota bacterium]|jgi:NAD(P)-dependent dehydrogenase (short-subunit alcohol dehydrogenase family)|nr:glucose 1-dehydrogenase [Chloroflexota bacterium]MDP6508047.1 glucose 1-dehydrogenase [Chloroflexota bacterium]MDP6758114.1 glucose 1-dehydrogenase [Chloroflexota bacterium]
MGLDGKVAIVTGAAQGIGHAVAWELALAGAAVTVADIESEMGQALAAAVRADGHRALFLETDLAEPAQIERMVTTTVAEFGRLDILVNNAAIVGRTGTVAEETVERWDEGLAVNVRAVALGMKLAVPEMRRVGGGAIVNISSVHGFLAAERHVVYDTCKHAVLGLTRQSALDLGSENIRVNAICPGFIVSNRREAAAFGTDEQAKLNEAIYPLRRVGRPHDIAAAVRYLVSDDAAFVTGVALPVDGGMSVQLVDSVTHKIQAVMRKDEPAGPPNTPPLREYP